RRGHDDRRRVVPAQRLAGIRSCRARGGGRLGTRGLNQFGAASWCHLLLPHLRRRLAHPLDDAGCLLSTQMAAPVPPLGRERIEAANFLPISVDIRALPSDGEHTEKTRFGVPL